jgi:hypothetical protein
MATKMGHTHLPHLAPTDSLRAQLQITAEEEAKAFVVMETASFGVAKGDYWRDVAWCLAVDAVRKKKTGDKALWSRSARLQLVTAIEKELRNRPGKKSIELSGILEKLRHDPRWPSDLSAGALRHVYYAAKPKWDRLEKLAQARGGSLLDDGWSFSI